MLPQANSRAGPAAAGLAATGHAGGRIVAAARGHPAVPLVDWPAGEAPGPGLRVGQVACWQVALTLLGLAIGRPWPVACAATAGAVGLLGLTGLRWRREWLYRWVWRYVRYRLRRRDRHLPREDGPRALLHLLAPDATLTAVQVGETRAAVISRAGGVTAVVRVSGPVSWPREPEVSARLVLHGVAGGRRDPLVWLAVRVERVPYLSDEDAILRALGAALNGMACVDRAELLDTLTSLAHAGDERGAVRERWRCWWCGPVAQAAFRVRGLTPESLPLLVSTPVGAVVTVSVGAGGAVLRVAALGRERLESSVAALRDLAGRYGVRLDRMDGEHADGVLASLPLG